MLIVTAAWAA